MNADAPTPLSESVVEFIAERLKIPADRLRADRRLNQDLGVDGDDAYELLIAFSEKFHLPPEGLVYSEHFGPEASLNPVSLWFRNRKVPITIGDLIQSASTREWQIRAKSETTTSP